MTDEEPQAPSIAEAREHEKHSCEYCRAWTVTPFDR